MTRFRSTVAIGFTFASLVVATTQAACSAAPGSELDPEGEETASGTKRPSAKGPALSGDTSDSGLSSSTLDPQDCSNNDEGCACTGQAPIPCFTGSADRRGQPGCKDGTRTCESHGEFRAWGACAGEVTTCSPPAAQTDAGTPPAQVPPVLTPGVGGIEIASPNYSQCAALPQAGKRGYGTCAANNVVVIVNDGRAQEMTCCPVSANVLSTVAAEQNVVRTGLCLADEVATGMQDPNAPRVFCTKINTTFLKLSAPTAARYVSGNVPGVLGTIARSYNVSDTCICDEGTIVIGGHTGSDNRCTDQCVRVEKK